VRHRDPVALRGWQVVGVCVRIRGVLRGVPAAAAEARRGARRHTPRGGADGRARPGRATTAGAATRGGPSCLRTWLPASPGGPGTVLLSVGELRARWCAGVA